MIACGNVADCFAVIVPRTFDIAFAIIAAASAIAAVTPTPRDDEWLGRVYRIVDALAVNIGYAMDRAKSAGGRFVAE